MGEELAFSQLEKNPGVHNNRKFSSQEIVSYLLKSENLMLDATEKVVPKIKPLQLLFCSAAWFHHLERIS